MAQRQNIILDLRAPESAGAFERNFPLEQVINIPLTRFKAFEPERIASLLGHIHADYPQGVDGVVLTSAKAAQSLSQSGECAARIKAMQKHDPAPIYCVGKATKNAAQPLDLGAIYEGDGGAKELAELACKTLNPQQPCGEGRTFLFPCGVHIHEKTIPCFLERDIKLVPLRVYDMPQDELARDKIVALIKASEQNEKHHYILPFFSMRTLEIFADIMNGVEEENKARWLARHSALCLSPVMVKLAQNTGFKNIASAKSPNALSMHEALGQLLKS